MPRSKQIKLPGDTVRPRSVGTRDGRVSKVSLKKAPTRRYFQVTAAFVSKFMIGSLGYTNLVVGAIAVPRDVEPTHALFEDNIRTHLTGLTAQEDVRCIGIAAMEVRDADFQRLAKPEQQQQFKSADGSTQTLCMFL